MSLCRLIYSSQAISGLTYPDLKDILEKSEKNNPPLGITGFLCLGNSMFLQMLEGERAVVTQTYNRIINDNRHFNIQLIYFDEIESRMFTDWSMKVVQIGVNSPPEVKTLILKYSPSAVFAPEKMTTSQCLNLMNDIKVLIEEKKTVNLI